MGLRLKLRKTFSSSSKKSNSTSSNKNTTTQASLYPNEPLYTSRTDIEYYKPNEIPKSKYKGRVDPAHQASLQAFSFSDAFTSAKRRTSLALSGTFSPGGTKSQSRVPSRMHSRRPSVAELEGSGLRSESRAQSISDGSAGTSSREKSADSNITSTTGGGLANGGETASTSLSEPALSSSIGTKTTISTLPTTVADSSSTPASSKFKLVPQQHDSGVDMSTASAASSSLLLSKQVTATHDTPFTAEELQLAMTRASLRPRVIEPEDS